MRAIALLTVISFGAIAADPAADAPYAQTVSKGDEVPFDGLLLTSEAAINAAKTLKESEAEAKVLRQVITDNPPVAWWVFPVVAIAAALAAGGVTLAAVNGSRPAIK
jgi:hypothetical protein